MIDFVFLFYSSTFNWITFLGTVVIPFCVLIYMIYQGWKNNKAMYANIKIAEKNVNVSEQNIKLLRELKKIDVGLLLYEKQFNTTNRLLKKLMKVNSLANIYFVNTSKLGEIKKEQLKPIIDNRNEIVKKASNIKYEVMDNILTLPRELYISMSMHSAKIEALAGASIKENNEKNFFYCDEDYNKWIQPSWVKLVKSCNDTFNLNIDATQIKEILEKESKLRDPLNIFETSD